MPQFVMLLLVLPLSLLLSLQQWTVSAETSWITALNTSHWPSLTDTWLRTRPAVARQQPLVSNLQKDVAELDKMGGGLTAHQSRLNAGAASWQCQGVCCSSSPPSVPSGVKTMRSRWFNNALYQGSKVHLWARDGFSFWGPRNNRTASWSGQLAAFRTQGEATTATALTVIRLSATTVRFQAPGGGFIEAAPLNRPGGYGVMQVARQATASTAFTFTRVGVGHLYVKTVYGTYVSWGQDEGLYHWGSTSREWELMRVSEIMDVPSFRGPNLGGWLFSEWWMMSWLWKGVPYLIDGAQLSLQSIGNGLYIQEIHGLLRVSTKNPSAATTFLTRREGNKDGPLQLRLWSGLFVTAKGGGGSTLITVNTTTPGRFQSFTVHLHPKHKLTMMLQAANGNFLRAYGTQLLADVAPSSVSLTSPAAWKGSTAFSITILKRRMTNYQLYAGIGTAGAMRRMRKHWNTWIQESDFQWIRDQGFTAVRVPIGYWVTQMNSPDAPYPPGMHSYLDWAFTMGVKYNIRIFLSLHAVPGNINDLEVRDGVTDWGKTAESVTKTLNSIEWIASRYKNNPMFAGLNVMNEPAIQIDKSTLARFNLEAVARVRKHSQCAYIAFMPRTLASFYEFWDMPGWPDKASNSIIDYHNYKIFGNSFAGYTPQAVMNLVRANDAADLKTVNKEKQHLTMVGEFCNSLPTPPLTKINETYRAYASTQMEVYGKHAEAGWFFWGYKQERVSKAQWSLKYGVDNGILVKKNGVWP